MKVLIICIGLIIMNISFIAYHGDMNRYLRVQAYLKALAEECAAGVALYQDQEAYSHGYLIIDEEEAHEYADFLVENAKEILSLTDGDTLSYQMTILDDKTGVSGLGISPSVEVSVQLTIDDLFRLPFIKVEQVVRSAKYELADY